MNIADFREYKLERAFKHLASARYNRLRGRHAQAIWYQYLASLARQSLATEGEYLAVMRNRMSRKG